MENVGEMVQEKETEHAFVTQDMLERTVTAVKQAHMPVCPVISLAAVVMVMGQICAENVPKAILKRESFVLLIGKMRITPKNLLLQGT
ncbi:unnamed protein product, partial [Iphiclides podalirius]